MIIFEREAAISTRLAPWVCARATLLALVLSACSPGSDLPELAQSGQGQYELGGGDELRLIVYGEPQMSSDYYVSDRGDISLPLLGDVRAAGLTPGELGHEIAEGLRHRKLMVDPSVAVDVIKYRPLYILGEVEKPGSYPYQPGLTMLSAVALAGGFTYRAVKDDASVVRTRGGKAIRGRVTPETFLEPGDVLTIYERFF